MHIAPGRGRQCIGDKILMTTERPFLFAHTITEPSPCAIRNFCKWLLYKCFMSLSLTVIQTNIKFLKITVTWTTI